MELTLFIDRPFAEIQAIFQSRYPFLKLELVPVAVVKTTQGSNPAKEMWRDLKRFEKPDRPITIDDNTTVSELVNQFYQKSGSAIRLLRKANNLWIETSLTEDWTLEKQNTAGKQLNTSTL